MDGKPLRQTSRIEAATARCVRRPARYPTFASVAPCSGRVVDRSKRIGGSDHKEARAMRIARREPPDEVERRIIR